ncbi:malate synthase [Flavimobilis soli]|uniref:Malate synthase n=1 Tax=Flavimobilis soli TaxID=442709 RepID=A0A2A9EDJ5_9MICO|nr:malate synthase [Flavimobilis soli]
MSTIAPAPPTTARMIVAGPDVPGAAQILTPEALEFVASLHERFAARRHEILQARQRARALIEDGVDPDFLPETRHVREDRTWRVAGPGPGLERRHVEITGPTDPKMAINALNSSANVWLADHEDALSPTWENVVGGQASLHAGIRGTLSHTSPEGKSYTMRSSELTDLPTIVMRPRGWHLIEKNMRFEDRAGTQTPASGTLVDFGLYFFHNAAELIARGRGPYFYLPKLEGRREARLWNDIFIHAQETLGIPRGTVRATALIETLPAAFEMDEILYELREHCAGLNAGRWDYLFSMIKNFRCRGPFFVLPDRGTVSMTVPFMRAYTELLVSTCHQRGAQAIGGMSAFIPDRRRPDVTERAEKQVRADKRREATDGFDGTWVAHPDLIPFAREEFEAILGDHDDQRDRLREDVHVTAKDLLDVASASGSGVTPEGLRANVSVAIRYIESWLRGVGAAAIDHLMEDAATAEISRSQVWQWIHNGTRTTGGSPITAERVDALVTQIVEDLPRTPGNRYDDAAQVFRDVALGEDFPTFLTIGAYSRYLA